jgi:hypothetical protein
MFIHPNGTAEEIVLDFPMQHLNQLFRSFKFERDHVEDNVCMKARDPRAESAFCLFGFAVHKNLFDGLPGRMRPIGWRCTAADVYNLVSTLDKRGHQVGSDMSTPPNDDNPSQVFLLLQLASEHIAEAIFDGRRIEMP